MLQRLFSRGVSRDRIEDAIEHSSEAEQRDALRERSAMILQRLENKRLEARRAELAQRRAEYEAAEQAEREADYAAAEEIARTAAEAEENETAMAEAAAPVEIAEEPAAVMVEFDEPQANDDRDDDTLELAEAPVHDTDPEVSYPELEPADVPDETIPEGEAEEDVTAEADAATIEYRPLEEPESVAEVTEYAEPASFTETDVEDSPASFAEAEDADFSRTAEETEYEADEPVARSRPSEEMFAESEPLRPAADINLPFPRLRNEGEAAAGETHHSALAGEDPQAYEQLLRKAEEAKARIAKRLEALRAEEEANASASLLDLGAAVPPLAPDHGDEDH